MTTTWHGWFGLGAEIKGEPAVVKPTPETIDIYVRGMDDRLYQKWWDGKKWNPSDSGWIQHDDGNFRLGSSPAVVANGSNFRDVYARNQDGSVVHKFWDGKKWNGWFGLGGQIKGAPAVVNPTPSTIDIYVRGMDDRLYQKWWDGKKWNPSDDGWTLHDDGNFRLGSSPAVISEGQNFRDVYVRGQDGAVYHKFWDGKKWSPWFGLGGQIKGAPSVVVVHPGFHDIYVQGMDDRLWQKWWDGKKWNPSDSGWIMHHDGNVRLASAPAVVAQGDTHRDVYVRGQNGSVLHKFWNNQKHSNATTVRADATRSAKIDNFVNSIVGTNKPGLSIAVIKGGQIVHLAGYGLANLNTKAPITSETMFHMASCGKQFTGLGIMMLKESKSNFGYDDALSKHVTKLSGYNSKVTIRRLLHHISDIRDMYDETGINETLKLANPPTNEHVIQAYVNMGFPMNGNSSKAGDEYVYSNSEYDMLGSVIEKASGQSYVDFFNSRVFRPLGMTDTFSFPDFSRTNDANIAKGYEGGVTGFVQQSGSVLDKIVGAGSFYSSVYDLCAYEEALAKNFLVSSESMKTAYTSGALNNGTKTNYGFGWGLGNFNGMSYADHGGAWTGFYSYIRRYINQSLSIYVLANRPDLDLVGVVNTATDAYK